jgi:Tol biopolymer transport system component
MVQRAFIHTQFLVRSSLIVTLSILSGCGPTGSGWEGGAARTPRVFAPGVISTPAREYGITFTPDGREAYFTRRARRGSSLIYVSRFVEGSWTEAEPASFSVERDQTPFVTADGARLFFSSHRPNTRSFDRSEDIWVSNRTEDGWATPLPIDGLVNQPRSEIGDFTTGTEVGPVLLLGGSLLYSTRADPDWGSDLYVADPDGNGAYIDPRPLRINSYGDESSPTMSPDGRHLIFQAYRGANAFGEQDLYASERTEHGWSEPWLLPEPVNSVRNDGYPSFSPDGRLFFFSSDRGEGFYDIYVVEVEALELN